MKKLIVWTAALFFALPVSIVFCEEKPQPNPVQPARWHCSGRTCTGRSRSYEGNPETIAREFLKENYKILGMPEDVNENIKVSRVNVILGDTIVEFTQAYKGQPVFEGGLIIMIGKDNCVTYVAKYVQDVPASPPGRTISSQVAIEIGRSDLVAKGIDYEDNFGKKHCKIIEVKNLPNEAESGIINGRSAYRFHLVGTTLGGGFWPVRYVIDAETGKILEKTSLVIVD
jgi:Zn-dependent metalloprotease